MVNLLQELNRETAGVIERVRSSLVEIRNSGGGVGSAVIWHSNGLLITNAHVIQRKGLEVRFRDGRILPARVLGYDDENDIAALGVEGHDLPVAEIGDSRELRPGQCVFALGNPWGVIGSVTAGIVVGTDGAGSNMRADDREWIVVDLQLRPGNSGGPLVDVGGRLVGINTMISGPEVGLAVPTHVVQGFLARLGESRMKQRDQADHNWLA